MLAVWLENGALSVRGDLSPPEPGADEALIKVHLAGICATDLEMVRGYYPFSGILGHEFVGEVLAAPGNTQWEGKRVVGEINLVCGECAACSSGRSHHCEDRTVLGIIGKDGAFAEFLTLPVNNLHSVPESIPDEWAVFCEPLAAALEILEQVHIHPSDRVLVIGAGRLGQLIARTIALTGCDLAVVTRRASQIALLKKAGLTSIEEMDISQRIWDIVIEATGSSRGFFIARQAVRPKGTIVVKSTYKGNLELNFSSIVVDEITLVGSRCGPFSPAIHLLQSKQVNPAPLISDRYPLSRAIEAFERAAQPGVFKILLEPAQ